MTTINEKFLNILREFIPDFLSEFPDYTNTLHPTIKLICDTSNNLFDEDDDVKINTFYSNSSEVLCNYYKEILYDDYSIFESSKKIKLEFIESIDFYYIWKLPSTSEETKTILFKYLKMFIISILSFETHEEKIGNTTVEILKDINSDVMKSKITHTLEELNEFFIKNESISKDIPKVESLIKTLENVSNGKIGQLAKEIADETFKDFDIKDDLNGESIDNIFTSMFNNPQKLMKMTKSISQKLDSKIKSGELKDSDLMQEASDIVSQMKNVPGFGDLTSILGLNKKSLSKNTATPSTSFNSSNMEKFWKQQSQMNIPSSQKSTRVNNKKKKKKK